MFHEKHKYYINNRNTGTTTLMYSYFYYVKLNIYIFLPLFIDNHINFSQIINFLIQDY